MISFNIDSREDVSQCGRDQDTCQIAVEVDHDATAQQAHAKPRMGVALNQQVDDLAEKAMTRCRANWLSATPKTTLSILTTIITRSPKRSNSAAWPIAMPPSL